MKRVIDEKSQRLQRVRVGAVGLATVLLLIGLASMILSGVRDRRDAAAAGGANAAAVANMAAPEVALNESEEPLADLGVAPGAASVEPAANAQTR